MAVAGVVAAVANRHLRPPEATREARRMPLAMLVRARSQVAEVTATLMMRTAMLTHTGGAGIAVPEVPGGMTHLLRERKAKRSSLPPFPRPQRITNPGSLMPVMPFLLALLTAKPHSK